MNRNKIVRDCHILHRKSIKWIKYKHLPAYAVATRAIMKNIVCPISGFAGKILSVMRTHSPSFTFIPIRGSNNANQCVQSTNLHFIFTTVLTIQNQSFINKNIEWFSYPRFFSLKTWVHVNMRKKYILQINKREVEGKNRTKQNRCFYDGRYL